MDFVCVGDISIRTSDENVSCINRMSYCAHLDNQIPGHTNKKLYVAITDIKVPKIEKEITFSYYYGNHKNPKTKKTTLKYISFEDLALQLTTICNNMFDEECEEVLQLEEKNAENKALAENKPYVAPEHLFSHDPALDIVIKYLEGRFVIEKGLFQRLYLSYEICNVMKLHSNDIGDPFGIFIDRRTCGRLCYFTNEDADTCYLFFPSLCTDKSFVNNVSSELMIPINCTQKDRNISPFVIHRAEQQSFREIYFSLLTKELNPFSFGVDVDVHPISFRILFLVKP